MAGHAYKSAVEELDNIVSRDLVSPASPYSKPALTFSQDAPFRATVLEPVGKLCSYFPTVNEGIAKRNKKVSLDFRGRDWSLTFLCRCSTMMLRGPKSVNCRTSRRMTLSSYLE